MRLYYIDESEGPRYYVRSALGVDAERWNEVFHDIHEWRRELRESRGIPTDRELHACDLLAGRGLLVRNDKVDERLTKRQGAEVFVEGLRCIEDTAVRIGGLEVINVCLYKPDAKAYEKMSLDRLLNRINSSVRAAGTHAFLIFDEGNGGYDHASLPASEDIQSRAKQVRTLGGGREDEEHPVENVIGGPSFRSSDCDYLLQMTDFIAHALLKQEEEPVPRIEDLGVPRSLLRPRPRPQPEGVAPGPSGDRQAMKEHNWDDQLLHPQEALVAEPSLRAPRSAPPPPRPRSVPPPRPRSHRGEGLGRSPRPPARTGCPSSCDRVSKGGCQDATGCALWRER